MALKDWEQIENKTKRKVWVHKDNRFYEIAVYTKILGKAERWIVSISSYGRNVREVMFSKKQEAIKYAKLWMRGYQNLLKN